VVLVVARRRWLEPRQADANRALVILGPPTTDRSIITNGVLVTTVADQGAGGLVRLYSQALNRASSRFPLTFSASAVNWAVVPFP